MQGKKHRRLMTEDGRQKEYRIRQKDGGQVMNDEVVGGLFVCL